MGLLTLGNVANVVSNLVIDGCAGVAGATTATYIIERDVFNDEDTSLIVGIGAGVVVAGTVSAVGHGVKNSVVNGIASAKEQKLLKEIQADLLGEDEDDEEEEEE